MSKAKILKEIPVSEYGMPLLEGTEDLRASFHADRSALSLEEIEREAYEKGFQAGEKAGFEVGEKKAELLVRGLEEALRGLEEFRSRLVDELSPRVFDLGVAVAKRILRDELRDHPEHLMHLIKEAIVKLERSGTVTIRVHPMLAGLIEKHSEEIRTIHNDIKIEVDPSVSPAGPVVKGPEEVVLTDYEGQMENLLEELGRNGRDSHH